jgi:hypothetical protein
MVAIVVAAGLTGGCGQASSSSRLASSPGAASKRSLTTWREQGPGVQAAEQAAQRLVGAAVIPPGAQRLATSPSRGLDRSLTAVGAENVVERHAWWKVSLSAAELLAFLRNHPPAGMASGVSASRTDPHQAASRLLSFSPTGASRGQPTPYLTVEAASKRTSWLRVDGQTIWYAPRPAAEYAPTSGTVTISLSNGPARKVTDPQSVRRLATEFNRLDRRAPLASTGVACSSGERTLSIAFTKAGGLKPTLVAGKGSCGSSWLARGPNGGLPAFLGGVDLLTDALRLLGLPANALWSPAPHS